MNETDSKSPNPTNQWPDDILHPTGLVGKLADYITRTAMSPQPKFSLGAALSTFGALLGRGVKDRTGQYTNLYTFALGYSNGGKNDPKRVVKELFWKLGREKILVEKTTSDSAEERLLANFPIRFHVLDEIGHYFGSLKSAGQNNPHLKTVIPMLTDLWSTPTRDGSLTGKTRCAPTGKEWQPPVQIPIPVVSAYATGSPDRLFQALSLDDLSDGAITRYLCFSSDTMPDLNVLTEEPFPEDLLQEIACALDKLGLTQDKYISSDILPEARVIGNTQEADELFEAFNDICRTSTRQAVEKLDPALYLYGKGGENARRVALIQACMRGPDHPCVTADDADFATKLVTYSINDMIQGIRQHVASNQRERDSKSIENIIRRFGTITLSDITSRSRTLDPRARKSILLDLCEAGVISEESVQGTGSKSVTIYRWIGYQQ